MVENDTTSSNSSPAHIIWLASDEVKSLDLVASKYVPEVKDVS